MSVLPLCFLLVVVGLVRTSHGLTCSPVTKNTCTKSLYVTGNCVSGVCECVKGMLPNLFGCYKPFQPNITVTEVKMGTSYRESFEDWNGEMTAYGNVKFLCNPTGVGEGNYRWFRNGQELKGKTSEGYTVYWPQEGTETYQCSINAYGSVTDKSDVFELNVLKSGEPFTKKPEVEMASLAELDSYLIIRCKHTPSFDGTFLFNVEGEEVRKELFAKIVLKMTVEKFNKRVTCTVKTSSYPSKEITSDPVTTPTAPQETLPAVHITGNDQYFTGQHMWLKCEFSPTFQTAHGDKVVYTWTGPYGVIKDIKHNDYQIITVTPRAAGKYSCTVTYNNMTVTSSPEFTVSVTDVDRPSVRMSGNNPIIGGYKDFKCHVKTNPIPSYYQFAWDYKYQTPIQAYSDNVIQFNNIKEEDFNSYVSCSPIRGTKVSIIQVPAPLPMSKLIQPKAEATSSKLNENNYDLTCESDYDTPGMSYQWFIDGIELGNGGSQIYTQLNPKPTDLACRLSFNRGFSDYSKNCTLPGKDNITNPVIQVLDSPTTFIEGASYSLKCSCFHKEDARYTWEKDGAFVTNSRHLLLQGIKSTDNGKYTCTMKLDQDSKVSEPLEIVARDHLEQPVIKVVESPDKFVKVSDDNPTNILPGKTYYLVCSSKAHQEHTARYGWEKDGEIIQVFHRILPLLKVSRYDGGKYKCNFKINEMTASSSVEIIVGAIDSSSTTTTTTTSKPSVAQRIQASIQVLYAGILFATVPSFLKHFM